MRAGLFDDSHAQASVLEAEQPDLPIVGRQCRLLLGLTQVRCDIHAERRSRDESHGKGEVAASFAARQYLGHFAP
jgi:hypothetical protein